MNRKLLLSLAPLVSFALMPPRRYYGGEDPAPAAPAGGDPGGDSPSNDLMTIELPDLSSSVDSILEGKAPTTPAKPEKTVGAKPEPAKPEPAKPNEPAKPGSEERVGKQLRSEYDAVKKERDELKATLEKGDPRLKEAEATVKAKEAELADHKKRISDYERRLALANPEVTKKLEALDKGYDADAAKFERSSALDRRTVNSLVSEFAKLPFNGDGYKEARQAFEAKVNEALGGSEENEHRKLGSTLDFIERTYDFVRERNVVAKEVEENALKLQREYEDKQYGTASEFVRTNIEKARKPPEGMKETDPFHPKVMLDIFEESIPEEQRAGYTKGLPEFIELVMAGPKPRSEADYVGMTPQDAAASRRAEQEKYETAKSHAVDVMYNGLRALRLFPTLVKEYQRLREKVKEDGESNPPDPTRVPGSNPGGGGDDIRQFKAPDLNSLNI